MTPRTTTNRLRALLTRIEEWEMAEEDGYSHPSITEELVLDIKQCLESILSAE